jgi:hypothetical protein
MALLRAAFKRLGAGEDAISLANLDGVELDSIAGLDLRLRPRPGRLQLIGRHRPVVIFDGTADQWETRARLLDPLIDQPGSGFQHLDYDRTGDATVIAETTA